MQNLQAKTKALKNLDTKEYLRPNEIYAVFGIDRATLYRWIKDKEFPKPLKPSPKITLINKKAFEEYLAKRTAELENGN
ncbi:MULTISPECIES: helix-turn-helix transcriptional regulator [unclassified Lebetimonas]|uniref:helix-turn-helix transcriptional regulator n=1 Tax=unclassified Lebetimonas TaxID=2648158 RepID=UPI000465149F|nr:MULTISPECIES: helix-turn-helix domain-containing protein [unclassified Lebetimonas]